MDLLKKSIAVLTLYQHRSGAFPASPFFPVYNYSWLRDGTFCAYALDLVREHAGSLAFYRWVNNTLAKYLPKLEKLEAKICSGNWHDDDFLHARFTLEGEEGTEPWGNFQLDGYGTYLWGIVQHCKLVGSEHILNESEEVVRSVAQYLQKMWGMECLDCWEENKDRHPSTLASIYGGLKSLEEFRPNLVNEVILANIEQFIFDNFAKPGYFTKAVNTDKVDSSLLWLVVPFGLVEPGHPLMQKTVDRITAELQQQGLYRYLGDTYYGGGQWILLTAWLGWYYLLQGQREEAQRLLDWIEAQADEYGQLPEQVNQKVQFPHKYQEWVQKWGEVAKPLLWSHAMHIVLSINLKGS
ncbi:glycoside hydrolase family 15 protein [Zhaonella formicivorans]|uniref:glycoside hydrolase family 15 protein n=1 Tax=Zhaonella formicivorans TaxID=2528593 RepID=UPI001D11D1D5|nr:glycoside hydrolase family 15 protein [Zhaonella formicivorans]